MISQLEKIGEELERAKLRLAQQEKRVKDLEARYRQVEKATVNEIVQAANVSPVQLAAILKAAEQGVLGVIPGADNDNKPEGTGPHRDESSTETENPDSGTSADSLPGITDDTFIYPDDSGYSLYEEDDE